MSGELPKLLATCRSQQELKSVSDAYAREAQGKATILDNILLDRKRKQAGLPIPARAASKPPVTKSNISAALASLNQSRDVLHHDQTERTPIRRYPLQPIEKPTPSKPPPLSGPATAIAASSLGNGAQPIGPAATSTIGDHGQVKGRSIAQQSAQNGGRGNSRESPEVNQSDGVRRHRRRRRRRKKHEDVLAGGSGAPSAYGKIGAQQLLQPGTGDDRPRSRTRQDSVGGEHRRIATSSPSPPPLKRNRRKPAQDGFPDYSDSEEPHRTPTAPKETAQWLESYGSNPGGATVVATTGASTASETPAERSVPLPLSTQAAAAGMRTQQQQPMAKAHFIDYGKGERDSRRAALETAFRRQLSIEEDEREEEEEDGDDGDNDDDEEEAEEQDDDAEDSAEESEVERALPVGTRKNADRLRERDVTQAPTRRTARETVDNEPSQVSAAVHLRPEVKDGRIARRRATLAPAKAPPPQQNEEKEEEEESEDEEEEQKHQKKILAIASQKRVAVGETAAAAQRASQSHSGELQSSDVLLRSTRKTKASGSHNRQQDDGGGSHEGLPIVALKATTGSSKVVVEAAATTKAAETAAVGLITETKRETRARDTAARAEAAAPKEASVSPPIVSVTPAADGVGARRLPPIKQALRGDPPDRKSSQDGAEARRSKNGGRDGFAGSNRRAKSPHSNVIAGGRSDSEDEVHQPAASVSALAKRLSRLSRSRSPSPVAAKAAGTAVRDLADTAGATGSLPELGSKKTRFQEGSTPPQQQQSHNQGGGGSTRRKKKRDMEAYVRALEQIVDSSLQYIIASTGEKLGIEQPLTVTKAKEKAEKASRASKKLRPSVVKKFLNGKYSKRVDAFLAEVE